MGGWQPLTTNESTQMHLICHTCNERIPTVLPYTNVNVCINTHTHKYQWTPQKGVCIKHKIIKKKKVRCIKHDIHLIPEAL